MTELEATHASSDILQAPEGMKVDESTPTSLEGPITSKKVLRFFRTGRPKGAFRKLQCICAETTRKEELVNATHRLCRSLNHL